ncbi:MULTISPECIES: glycosyltransferase family 2 protein [unclassified Methylophaga]|uniref:glycosyltransferase family 2 protein n=1 Tax=unclassified Methylophaga TaxID=2629249 RepID=UPI0025DC0D5B|nr:MULTISPECIES: glycosyltransferase family 2 protein [unclassified Methylophaga]
MSEPISAHSYIGAVVIGRNEGLRLKQCLTSLRDDIEHIVYVDSGSSDGSVQMALEMSVRVVELDMTKPFTAARARNAGLTALLEYNPQLDYVQFVDGDCEVQRAWLDVAFEFLSIQQDFAAVCGRRRERYPTATIYNQLCDIEWDTPIGEAKACGGDALFRVSALTAVDGYRDSLIAGEEPEMCCRMRQLGWKIMRIDAEMTLHDAAMTRFSQWWKRNQRAGHAYAEGYALHGKSSEKFKQSECLSILFWSFLLPLAIIVMSIKVSWMLVLFLVYPLQIIRLTLRYRRRLSDVKVAFAYAVSNVVGKWPQLIGMLQFVKNKKLGLRSQLIEYK